MLYDRNGDGEPDSGFASMAGLMDVVEVHPPDGIFSGPTLLGFADTALYAAAQAATGDSVRALVATMSVTFLKPAMAADVIAIARVISRTARTAHLEAWLFSHAAVDPILHATATSVLRPAD